MRVMSLALPAILIASLAAAQSVGPLPPLTEQVEVRVVNVDVSVTDKDGQPVRGLTKDDFEIFEDGVAQNVTNFAIINTVTSVAAAPEARRTRTDAMRRILLIVDNNFLNAVERNRALDVVEKYFDKSFGGEWAVGAIGHSAEMLQSFTSDRKLVEFALMRARSMPTFDLAHTIDRSPLSERFIHKGDVALPDDYKAKLAFAGREQTYRNLMTIQNTARAVVDTARAYSAEGGKKFIILLTGGMESNTTFTAFEKRHDYELEQLRLEMGQVADAMVREANGANFTVHIINARSRGMAAPQMDLTNHSSGMNSANLLRATGNDPIDVSDVDSIPLSIALGTGGMYLPSGDISASLQRIDTATSTFYSLGYSPQHDGDRQYHAIKVRVKRPGVRVANRVGYFDETPEDRLEQMLRARMSFDSGFATLPVEVSVGSATAAEHDLIVPVTAQLPLARLTVVPHDQSYVGRIHVYCSVFDGNGRNVGFSHKTQQVTIGAQQLSGSGNFRYTVPVHVQKGEAFTIVITLRDELSNEIGTASEAVRL